MTIEVFGFGCSKCALLARRAEEAARESGLPFTIAKVDDAARFVALGVMQTPALVVDGKVVLAGRVPTVAALRELLAHA